MGQGNQTGRGTHKLEGDSHCAPVFRYDDIGACPASEDLFLYLLQSKHHPIFTGCLQVLEIHDTDDSIYFELLSTANKC